MWRQDRYLGPSLRHVQRLGRSGLTKPMGQPWGPSWPGLLSFLPDFLFLGRKIGPTAGARSALGATVSPLGAIASLKGNGLRLKEEKEKRQK